MGAWHSQNHPQKKTVPSRVGNTERELRATWLEPWLLENQKKESELKEWGTRESSLGKTTTFVGEVAIILKEKKETMGSDLELCRNKRES